MSKLDGSQTSRCYAPERGEIEIDLIIFVWELDVVLLDIGPPFIEARWRCSGVSAAILTDGIGECFAGACEFCVPFLFCMFDEVEDGVSTTWVDLE